MTDEFTLTLNIPITEAQWDAITDDDFEHMNEITFYTKHGKEVKFVKASAQPEDYAHGFVDGYKQGKKDAEPERKKGEWIGDTPMVDTLICSECGYNIIFKTPYCPNCGADMRGDEDETD